MKEMPKKGSDPAHAGCYKPEGTSSTASGLEKPNQAVAIVPAKHNPPGSDMGGNRQPAAEGCLAFWKRISFKYFAYANENSGF